MRQGQTLPMTTDIYTLISSFSTLLRTLSASSVLRAALSDTLDLLREFIAHTAHDVEQTASKIQHRAEEVEAKARESLEHGPPSANEPIVLGIRTEAKEVLNATKADVFQAAESVKKGIKDVREGSVQAGQDILIARLYKVGHQSPRFISPLTHKSDYYLHLPRPSSASRIESYFHPFTQIHLRYCRVSFTRIQQC